MQSRLQHVEVRIFAIFEDENKFHFLDRKKMRKNEMRKILRDANCIRKAHKISSIQMPWDLGYLVIPSSLHGRESLGCELDEGCRLMLEALNSTPDTQVAFICHLFIAQL